MDTNRLPAGQFKMLSTLHKAHIFSHSKPIKEPGPVPCLPRTRPIPTPYQLPKIVGLVQS